MDATNLSRRDFTRTGALALSSTVGPFSRASRPAAPAGWPEYDRVVVIDALASPGPFNVPNRTAHPLTPTMIANARRSGMTAVNVTVNAGGTGREAFDGTIGMIAYFQRELTAHPDALQPVRTIVELRRAKATRRLGLILGFQDTNMLEGDPDRLELFANLGVRIIQLTYNARNQVGDGCLEPGNAGLSRFGRQVVERMNDLGILVDLSHCGQQTTADAIRQSGRPVAITHSGCSAVFAHPRSKRDEELQAMADRGGVIGIYLMPFLNPEGPPHLEHVLQHIEHAVNVCGEDHVGIGSDNSITPTVADDTYRRTLYAFADERARLGIGAPREHEVLFVEELNDPRRMDILADALAARGHSTSRIEKILGANFLRLFHDVWTS